MKVKKILAFLLSAAMIFCSLPFYTLTINAETEYQEEYFTYINTGSIARPEITITDCDTSIYGDVVIPLTLGGYTVTGIGDYAFAECSDITSITIHENISHIGDSAFDGCYSLNSIHITDIAAWCNVTFFNDSSNPLNYARYFYINDELVTDLVIPYGVSNINHNTFSNYGLLKTVTLSDSVTNIGSSAFWGCTSLASVTLSNSVTSIEHNAFAYCNSLTSIQIPKSVISIGSNAFYGCSKLNSIFVDENNTEYCSLNGVLFDKCMSVLILYPRAKTDISYVIPDGVKKIENNAFENCSSLNSIKFPDSISKIGEYSFRGCANLISITIPDNDIHIGRGAFYNTAYYKDLGNWDNDVLYIGNHLIEAKTSIIGDYTINANTKTIADNAFYHCDSLTSIIIPDGITRIGDDAFYYCTSLISIILPDNDIHIGSGAFYNTAYYKDLNNWKNDVLYIGNHLIKAKTSITGDYTINENTKTIADNAFYHCGSLTSIIIPDCITRIGDWTFADCGSLSVITIPDSIIQIHEYAFYYCSSLNTVYYRSDESIYQKINIDEVGNNYLLAAIICYNSCIGDTEHKYDTCIDETCNICNYMRNAQTHIYENNCDTSCNECGDIRTITHTFDNACDEVCNVCSYTRIVESHIYDNSCDTDCNECGNIRTIEHIYDNACDEICNICNYLRTVEPHLYDNSCDTECNECGYIRITEHKYTAICDKICNVCSYTRITVPHTYDNDCDIDCNICANVRTTEHTYDNCLDEICNICGYKRDELHRFDGNSDVECNDCNYYRYITYTIFNNEVTIDGYTDDLSGEIVIPSTLAGCPVTHIEGEALAYCGTITAITIPDSVIYIDSHIINSWDMLKSITVDINNPKYSSSNGVLFNKDKSELICYPSEKSGSYYTIPSSVTGIGSHAFYNCGYLTSVTIPSSVSNIAECAFNKCGSLSFITVNSSNKNYCSSNGVLFDKDKTNLICYPAQKVGESYIIPNSVTSIANYAFYLATSLVSVTIPEGVINIGDYSFYNCYNLASAPIPYSVKSIGEWAFSYCSLSDISISDNVENIGIRALGNALITVDNNNTKYCSVNGILFNKDMTELISYPSKNINKTFVVPNGVKKICDYAFSNRYIISVTISDGVEVIGEWAFNNCSELTSLTIPNTVQSIGYYAFCSCYNLKDIYIMCSDANFQNVIIDKGNYYFESAIWHFNSCIGSAEHTYDNCVDEICNICNYIRIAQSHNYDNSCDTICNICGDTRTIEHTYDAVCDGICNICNYTRIAESHTYDNSCDIDCNICGCVRTIEHIYDNTCDTICNVCGYGREIEHNYIGVLTQPTCTNKGYTTNTCSVCGDSYIDNYTEAIGHRKTVVSLTNSSDYPFAFNEGVYNSTNKEHSSSSTFTITALHDYKLEIQYKTSSESNYDKLIILHNSALKVTASGPDNIWKTLILNLNKDDKIYIEYSKDGSVSIGDDAIYFKFNAYTSADNFAPTCEEDVICDVCGIIVKYATGHSYDNNCDINCNLCENIREVNTHIYANSCDTTCNECGDIRTIEHTYYNACDIDCNICGHIRTVNPHIYDNTCDTTCNECGYVRSIEHTYDNNCDTECNMCGDMRSIEHTYDNICDTNCNICGNIRAIEHAYTNACDTKCNVCGQTRAVEPHIYENSCDTTCNECGSIRSIEHTYTAVCDEICNICGNIRSTIAHTYDNSCDTTCNICGNIRTIEHTYDNPCDTECNICKYIRTVEPHSFDGSDDVQCNNCDYVRYIMFDITNGEVTVLGYIDGFSGAITIPEKLCDYPVTGIADTAFAGCNTLSRITIAGSIKNIPDSAFKDCTKLLRVTINEGTESIGANAFEGCVNLINVILPNTLNTIGTNAFYDCGDLKIIAISDIKSWCETDFGNAYSNPLYYAPTLNLNEKKVTDLGLPIGVTTVKNYAFYNYKALSNITFPDTVESIGKRAFYGCTSLTDIVIPDSVSAIEFAAFEGCSSLANMTVPFVGENAEEDNNFGYIFGSERIIDNGLYVPESLKSVAVSDNCRLIPKSAFENCQYIECLTLPFIGGSELENRFLGYIFGADYSEENADYIPSALCKIIISDNCVGIAEMAFYGCENLKKIIIPESIVSIGRDAFENCVSLQKVDITSLTAWCNIDFVNKYSNPVYYGDLYLNGELLTIAELSEEVADIKDYTFINCDSLKFVEFTENINTIGDHAFYGCSQIAEIILPDNTMGIGVYAFCGCENLTRLDTGNGLATIDRYAFYNTGLIDIYLGDGIWYIDENAFGLCEDIACVYYSSNIDKWENEIYIEELGNDSLLNALKKYNSSPLAEVGDLNGDGVINVIDLVRLKKILAGCAESGKTTSDLDRNGATNSMDITVFRKFLLGVISDLKQILL